MLNQRNELVSIKEIRVLWNSLQVTVSYIRDAGAGEEFYPQPATFSIPFSAISGTTLADLQAKVEEAMNPIFNPAEDFRTGTTFQ